MSRRVEQAFYKCNKINQQSVLVTTKYKSIFTWALGWSHWGWTSLRFSSPNPDPSKKFDEYQIGLLGYLRSNWLSSCRPRLECRASISSLCWGALASELQQEAFDRIWSYSRSLKEKFLLARKLMSHLLRHSRHSSYLCPTCIADMMTFPAEENLCDKSPIESN